VRGGRTDCPPYPDSFRFQKLLRGKNRPIRRILDTKSSALVMGPKGQLSWRLLYFSTTKMSKPRTFLSSTCFDFADARSAIAEHLKLLGHEPIRSDTAEFGVSLGKHSHEACLDQVDNCDYLILLIGGRRGGTFVGSEKSITNEEYRRALKKRKPIITFVKRKVELARRMYKKNPKGDFTGVVDVAAASPFRVHGEKLTGGFHSEGRP
jgi:Domain of unknown function (DUF4062)